MNTATSALDTAPLGCGKPHAIPPIGVKAHDPLTPIAPNMVSQLNCLPTVGVDDRRFRETVRKLRIPHTRLGQLVLVRIEDWRAAMAKLAKMPSKEPAPFKTAEELLEGWGVKGRVKR